MSHTLYTTPGIILASQPRGEANRVLSILTRDLGFIHVHAQSLRALQSKLRFHTQLFSHAIFTCVRSKQDWRLVGAESLSLVHSPEVNEKEKILSSKELELLSRISKIIRTYVQGEEPHSELYDWVIEVIDFCQRHSLQADEEYSLLEILCIAKILFLLGYIDYPVLGELTLSDGESLQIYSELRSELITAIHEAFATTQM